VTSTMHHQQQYQQNLTGPAQRSTASDHSRPAAVLTGDRVKYDAEADADRLVRQPAGAVDLRAVSHGFIAAVAAPSCRCSAHRCRLFVSSVYPVLVDCFSGNLRSAYVQFTYVQRLRWSEWLCGHRPTLGRTLSKRETLCTLIHIFTKY